MTPLARQFLKRAVASQLISQGELQAECEQLRAQDPQALGDPQALAERLVSAGLLTAWQADNLLQGRYRGFTLGNYRLLDQLGQGGMSTVYLGEHLRMGRQVAIKVLPKRRVKEKAYFDRFLAEAQAAAALDHPNIVRAYDFASEGEVHFLVMERLQGQTLAELVATGHPLPIADLVGYFAEAAAGLQYAHTQGLVHRDVKPANLMVGPNGQLKVLDLGLARLAVPGEEAPRGHAKGIMGTADYIAPEQATDSDAVDARADVYGLGCTFYFALTGQPPCPSGTTAQKIAWHQGKAPPPSIRVLRSDCPADLEQLVQQMMAKEVTERMESMAMVIQGLKGVQPIAVPQTSPTGRLGPPSSAAPPVQVTVAHPNRSPLATRPKHRRRKTPMAFWIALLALCLAAIWLLQRLHQRGGFGLW